MVMQAYTKIMASVCMCGLVAACGNTPGQRALSGGAIGAAGGAGIGALTGGSVGEGALIGGAAGALTGAVTNRRQLDLGDFP